MPYKIDGNCVVKSDTGETVKCHDSHDEAVAHLQALQANVRHSGVVEMSMRISKASYNKSETNAMRWTAIDSDIDADLYDERMSIELYKDFVSRIENNTPIPEPFAEAICEHDWCGGTPYLSIAHYKAGTGLRNVPGAVESVFIDGTRLKSKGTLHDNEMGRRVFNALREDLYMKEKSVDHRPVRISIGFLDLEHKHLAQAGGQEFTFTRSDVGQICPLCVQGIGGKIYMKGQLVHLAMTRVPVNPRTEMGLAEKSMDEITTKRDDAKSIIGELADDLEEKSIAKDVLVVRADEVGSAPTASPSEITKECYDPNTGGWDNECISRIMEKYLPEIRKEIGVPVKSETAQEKALLDAVVAHMYKSFGLEQPVEDAMEAKSETVEKMQAGGVNVPVQKFNYEGISGDVDANKTASPIPTKAENEEEEEEKKEYEEMSALDKSFASLKALVDAGKKGNLDVDAINKAFTEIGTTVEKEVAPAPKPVDMTDLAAIVRSAVEEVVQPLRLEIATMKATQGQAPVSGAVVKSKALTPPALLNPGGVSVSDLVQRAGQAPAAPTRKLTQIEMLARKSTGASVE